MEPLHSKVPLTFNLRFLKILRLEIKTLENWQKSRNYRRIKDAKGDVVANIITVDGIDVEVTEEVFLPYSQADRRERYQEERQEEHPQVSRGKGKLRVFAYLFFRDRSEREEQRSLCTLKTEYQQYGEPPEQISVQQRTLWTTTSGPALESWAESTPEQRKRLPQRKGTSAEVVCGGVDWIDISDSEQNPK